MDFNKMELQLKNLAPYLPYNLEMELLDFPLGKHIRVLELDCGHDFHYYLQSNKVRPLLRPLSQLTEEIEHNGEIFEPRRELFLTERKFHTEKENVLSIEWGKKNENHFNHHFYHAWPVSMEYKLRNGQKTSMAGTFSMREMEFEQWQKLFEWHFDVFNLIPNNLAIEKQ